MKVEEFEILMATHEKSMEDILVSIHGLTNEKDISIRTHDAEVIAAFNGLIREARDAMYNGKLFVDTSNVNQYSGV